MDKRCIECGAMVPKEARKCKCGFEYGDPPPPIESLPEPEEQPKKRRRRKKEEEPTSPPPVPPALAYDKIFPWGRFDPRYPIVIAPCRTPDGSPFVPAEPRLVKGTDDYSTEEDNVLQWVEELVLNGYDRRVNYSLTAILYFAAKLWPAYRKSQTAMESHPDFVKVQEILIRNLATS